MEQDRSAGPNVVLFIVDDMGWMDSSAYGSEYYETPNIDRLAEGGMLFTDAYAASPVCSPTRASILTGKYPARLGITGALGHLEALPEGTPPYPEEAEPDRPLIAPHSRRFVDPQEHTLPKALREAGYRTGHFGKWHLGSRRRHWPDQHFDVAWSAPYASPNRPEGYFAPYHFRRGTIEPGPPGEYLVDRLTDEAIGFIEDNRERPFFLNAWQWGVHGPWDHKEQYTERFARKQDPRGEQGNPIMASMLQSIDESVGRIMSKLDELGLTDRTIILFSSDHGGNVLSNTPGNWRAMEQDERRKGDWLKWAGERPPTSNAPLREGKASVYEGGVRVPLIVSWPGEIAPSTRSSEVVMSIDFYPTLLDLLGLQLPDDDRFDGISFAPVLRDASARLAREAVFNFMPHDPWSSRPGVSVRRGDWKLIRRFDAEPDESYELYDLREDIGETTNLARQQPDIVRQLDALIDGFLRDTGALVPKPNPAYEPGRRKTARS